MKRDLISLLRCPRTGQPLDLQVDTETNGEVESGWLVSKDGKERYPVRGGVARFVPQSNYADNFGMQWKMFSRTQLDSYSGHPITADRFWKSTGWTPEDLRGRWVLDVGCGAGRFAEIAAGAGANLVALDYSTAVEAARENLAGFGNVNFVQGDIFALPFVDGAFSFVYCLGVLQHTPDVAGAFAALPRVVAPGGRLSVDYYEKSLKALLQPKYWLRPVTRRIPKERLFGCLQKVVPMLLPVSRGLAKLPMGHVLRRLVPVADYDGVLPLSEKQRSEWALLDTFDWLAPRYDQPQTAQTAAHWFEKAGMQQVEVDKVGHLVARGVKPG